VAVGRVDWNPGGECRAERFLAIRLRDGAGLWRNAGTVRVVSRCRCDLVGCGVSCDGTGVQPTVAR
jgi:hypothetical protein